MRAPPKPEVWREVAGTTSVNLGPVQLYCYPDPNGDGYRFKVGSLTSDTHYRTMASAQYAGLKYLKKLGKTIVDGAEALLKNWTVKKKEKPMDAFHISILGLDKETL